MINLPQMPQRVARLSKDERGYPVPAFVQWIKDGKPALRGGGSEPDFRIIRDDFRARAATVYHPVGTCRMGAKATDSVVDSSLRVHGIAGLRVVDASVFPSVTSANTNAPTLMVAQKAADLIYAAR